MDDFPREHAEFPREYARTQRFTLGRPRSITVSPDGSRVVFTRSRGGTDPVNCLWVYDVADKTERLVADPRALLGGGNEQVSEEERARRERTRELAGGITSYATDAEAVGAAFALNGKLFRADLTGGTRVYDLGVDGPAFDPRPSPDGGYVAYVAGGGLHVIDEDGRTHTVVQEDGVSWGVAEFVAAEEMGRHRGFWWSPDSDRLLAARVDDSPVQRWHIADPANPGREPVEIAYPRAGTANADVRLSLLGLYGTRVDLDWDRDEFPYLVTVHWSEYGPPLVLVQSRDQRRTRLLTIDVDTGAVATLREDTSPTWLEIMPGVPAWTPGGELVWVVEDLATDTRRLVVDGTPATPAGMHVRGVAAVDATGVVVSVSEADPAVTSLVRVRPDGSLERLADGGGVHAYAGAGGTSVVATAALDGPTTYQVTSGDAPAGTLASLADEPSLELNLSLRWAADLRAAVLLPHGHQPGVRLPVLVSPAGRAPSGCWRPGTATCRTSGSPTRATRWWSWTAGARRAGRSRSRRRSPAGTPTRCWTIRSPGCGRSRSRSPSWTWTGWRSGAGRSAGTWRRWPCCGGRRCSTRRSPARRSPTARCTTPTTPSGTSACRTSGRRRTGTTRSSTTRRTCAGRC
jgi:dipeptidyl-peptidase 4